MPHSPDHSLASIATGSVSIHMPSPSPSPAQSEADSCLLSPDSSIPHSALSIPHSSTPPSPPPPLPPEPADFDDLDAVRETIQEVELANRLWLKAHRAATAPKDYNIPWINQVAQALCRTMSWRKTLHCIQEQKHAPKPSPTPTPPPAPALVSIDRRALDPLKRIYYAALEEEARAAKSGDPTGSADVPSAPAPSSSPVPLPSSIPGLFLGPRTSPSATAPDRPSATAALENAAPASPLAQAAPPAAAHRPAPVAALEASGCATIRAVPVCPTLHRLIPDDAPDAPNPSAPVPPIPSMGSIGSMRSMESIGSIESISPAANPQFSPSPSTRRSHNPWFNKPFPAPDPSNTLDSS